jgi:hypothetical protein
MTARLKISEGCFPKFVVSELICEVNLLSVRQTSLYSHTFDSLMSYEP